MPSESPRSKLSQVGLNIKQFLTNLKPKRKPKDSLKRLDLPKLKKIRESKLK